MKRNSHIITSAHNIDEKLLFKYYSDIYQTRYNSLKRDWRWQFRTDYFKNQLPLVVINNKNEVLAHLGTIPFKMVLDGKIFDAQWWIDFSVHPNYRRQGLGKLLTKKCMEFADIQITCCNEKAIKIFKLNGWFQSNNSYYHIIWINPANYKKFNLKNMFLKNVINKFSKFILNKKYINNFDLNDVSIENLYENSFKCFSEGTLINGNVCHTKKDISYFKWRFLESNDADYYKLFKIKNSNIQLIIKLNDKNHGNYVSVLTQTFTSSLNDLTKVLSTLAIWSDNQGFDYIDYYTNDLQLSSKFMSKFFSYRVYQNFAFYSNDKSIFDNLKKTKHHFDFCDSDFEKYYE